MKTCLQVNCEKFNVLKSRIFIFFVNVSEMDSLQFSSDFAFQKAAIDNWICIHLKSIVFFDEENKKITWRLLGLDNEQLISEIVVVASDFMFLKHLFESKTNKRCISKTHVVCLLEYLHEHRSDFCPQDLIDFLKRMCFSSNVFTECFH